MAIVSSSFVLDAHAQADGSRYVVQQFTDSQGRSWRDPPYKLLAGQGAVEAQARLNAAVTYLNEQLAEQEADAILNGP